MQWGRCLWGEMCWWCVWGDWIKRTCCRMAGEEKLGYFRLSEGTEGEDGSLSSGYSWLGVLCEWRWKLTTDCFSFVCKKSCKVISCYRRGGRWWRGTEEIIKCSEEITHIWSIVDLVMEMWRFGSVDFSGERWKKWLIHTQVRRLVWFSPFADLKSDITLHPSSELWFPTPLHYHNNRRWGWRCGLKKVLPMISTPRRCGDWGRTAGSVLEMIASLAESIYSVCLSAAQLAHRPASWSLT